MSHIKKSDNIPLPQVKKVTIEVIPPFDIQTIRDGLKKRNLSDFDNLKWPEAEKAMFRNVVEAEHKILHIKSCCDKALEDNIIPLKNYLWNKILCHSVSKEI